MKNFLVYFALAIAGFFSKTPSFRLLDPLAGADVYADLYDKLYNTKPPAKVGGKNLAGRVRIFRATYTQGAADGNIGDVIRFGKLPAGAAPVPCGKAFFSAGNANATLKIGYVGNDACFAAATAINAAGSVALEAGFASGANLDLAAETEVIGTNAVAAIKAAQKITVFIPYVMND